MPALFAPIILDITIILGRLRAGPVSSMVSAGPLPIPNLVNALIIGTSVSVLIKNSYNVLRIILYNMFNLPFRSS